MALAKSKLDQLPGGAVVLTEHQALLYQTELITKWPKSSDVFALKYGPYFLGGAAFLSGFFINNHFRRKFMLSNYGRISTYFPICVMPATTSMLLHTEFVLNDVILMKGDKCPVCLELRSAAFQSMISVIFPFVIAPMGCAALAQRYATINLPYITDKPWEVLKIVQKMVKPIRTTLWYIFIAQAILGSVVTYFEAKSIIKLSQELALKEEEEQLFS